MPRTTTRRHIANIITAHFYNHQCVEALHVDDDNVGVLHCFVFVDEILDDRRQRLKRYSTANDDMPAVQNGTRHMTHVS